MFDPQTAPFLAPSDRRVALITGGNSGIGWFTVLHLYMHGYNVYIAGRNAQRVETAIVDIKNEATERMPHTTFGTLHYLHMDLQDLATVVDAVTQFKRLEPKLDVLIDNAGIMATPYAETVDGFEVQIQTNYVAHVLLDELLLPLMKDSVDPRIVYVSSIGHVFCVRRFAPSLSFNYWPNIFFTFFRYGMAKTFGIHYIRLLALRHPEILSAAVHPGFVLNTNLFSYWTRLPIVGSLFWMLFQVFGYFFGVSNEEGSLATLKAAMAPLNKEKDNGKYYLVGGEETRPWAIGADMNYALQSYEWCKEELKKRGFL